MTLYWLIFVRGGADSFVPSLPFMYLKKSLQHYSTLIKVELRYFARKKLIDITIWYMRIIVGK